MGFPGRRTSFSERIAQSRGVRPPERLKERGVRIKSPPARLKEDVGKVFGEGSKHPLRTPFPPELLETKKSEAEEAKTKSAFDKDISERGLRRLSRLGTVFRKDHDVVEIVGSNAARPKKIAEEDERTERERDGWASGEDGGVEEAGKKGSRPSTPSDFSLLQRTRDLMSRKFPSKRSKSKEAEEKRRDLKKNIRVVSELPG